MKISASRLFNVKRVAGRGIAIEYSVDGVKPRADEAGSLVD